MLMIEHSKPNQSADGLGLTLQVNPSFTMTGEKIEFNLQLVNLTEQKAFTITCKNTIPPGNYTAIGWFLFAPTFQDTVSFVVMSDINQ